MTTGPIEFLSDSGPAHEVPDTEFGGADGLIQPTSAERLNGDPDASGGHDLESDSRLTVSEIAGIMRRRAFVPLGPLEAVTGVVGDTEIVDPHTGRVAPESRNKTGGVQGEMGDMKVGQ